MVIQEGDKILVIHRRLYDGDSSRYFVGVVDGYETGIAKITGQSWLRDALSGSFVRKEGSLTKVVSLSSGTLIVYHLPWNADLSKLRFESTPTGMLWLTDGDSLKLNLTESGHHPARRHSA